MSSKNIYTSHEAILLDYENAFIFKGSESKHYCCSGHMLWVGDRTRELNGAHIEFVRGIGNPIGLKIGPSTDVNELIKIIDTINPENTAGRITLICRMGADSVSTKLPIIVSKVEKEGKKVVWTRDPMHGNTV